MIKSTHYNVITHRAMDCKFALKNAPIFSLNTLKGVRELNRKYIFDVLRKEAIESGKG